MISLVQLLLEGLLVLFLAGVGGWMVRRDRRVATLLGAAAAIRSGLLLLTAVTTVFSEQYWAWVAASTWRSMIFVVAGGCGNAAVVGLLLAAAFTRRPAAAPSVVGEPLDRREARLLALFGGLAALEVLQHAVQIVDEWSERSWVMQYMSRPTSLPSGDPLLPFSTPLEVLGFGAVGVLGVLCVTAPDRQKARALMGLCWGTALATSLVYFVRWSGPLDKLLPGWFLENPALVLMTLLLPLVGAAARR